MSSILSFDISTTCIGHAGYDLDCREYLYALCGWFVPAKKSAPARERLLSMVGDVYALIRDASPAIIVVESMDRKQHTRHSERTTGLPVCAWGMGYIEGYIAALFPDSRICAVPNQEWTKGKKKELRPALAASVAPRVYTPGNAGMDKGRDLADAILILDYWLHLSASIKATMAGRRA